MNAIPTPPKKVTVTQKGTGKTVSVNPNEGKPKKPFVPTEHLTHRPFNDHQDLKNLKDKLEFAPRGEEHQKEGHKR